MLLRIFTGKTKYTYFHEEFSSVARKLDHKTNIIASDCYYCDIVPSHVQWTCSAVNKGKTVVR